MSVGTTGKNAAVNAVTALATYLGVKDTTATEAVGGSYARTALEWDTAASGEGDNTNAETINVPAGTYAFLAGYTASAAGSEVFDWPMQGGLTATERLPVEVVGEADDELLYARAHGFSDTNRVVLFSKAGASVPTGLTADTVVYYVVSATANSFSLSLTSGGAAVNITADGRCWAVRCVPETFAAPGQVQVAAGDLDMLGTLL